MPFVIENFFEALYGITTLYGGLLLAVGGFFACRFLPWQVRWMLPLLLLVTTMVAVRGSAHHYGKFLTGVVSYILCSFLGLYFRARQTHSTVWMQRPFDLFLFGFGVTIASFFYEEPMA